jgi:hypothetical protein
VIEVDSSVAKECRNHGEIGFFAVHIIFAGVVLERLARYDKI